MDYLFWGPHSVHALPDRGSLLYVFWPLALRPISPRHVLAEVYRSAIHLSEFEFCLNHTEGAINAFSEVLSRWSKGYRAVTAWMAVTLCIDIDMLLPVHGANPVMKEKIISEQQMYQHTKRLDTSVEGLYTKERQRLISEHSFVLKPRSIVSVHCDEPGHRGFGATLILVSGSYWWTEVKIEIREFPQWCIHRIVSRTRERVPRPVSSTKHGPKPNKKVHGDFLYMGPTADSEWKYI